MTTFAQANPELEGRVGINTNQPKTSLDISKHTGLPEDRLQGVSFPNFSTEERTKFNNPVMGTMIYNTTKKCLEMYTEKNSIKDWYCVYVDISMKKNYHDVSYYMYYREQDSQYAPGRHFHLIDNDKILIKDFSTLPYGTFISKEMSIPVKGISGKVHPRVVALRPTFYTGNYGNFKVEHAYESIINNQPSTKDGKNYRDFFIPTRTFSEPYLEAEFWERIADVFYGKGMTFIGMASVKEGQTLTGEDSDVLKLTIDIKNLESLDVKMADYPIEHTMINNISRRKYDYPNIALNYATFHNPSNANFGAFSESEIRDLYGLHDMIHIYPTLNILENFLIFTDTGEVINLIIFPIYDITI